MGLGAIDIKRAITNLPQPRLPRNSHPSGSLDFEERSTACGDYLTVLRTPAVSGRRPNTIFRSRASIRWLQITLHSSPSSTAGSYTLSASSAGPARFSLQLLEICVPDSIWTSKTTRSPVRPKSRICARCAEVELARRSPAHHPRARYRARATLPPKQQASPGRLCRASLLDGALSGCFVWSYWRFCSTYFEDIACPEPTKLHQPRIKKPR